MWTFVGRTFAIGLVALAATLPAAAHHGWAAYDAAKQQKITGTVQRATFGNPHGELWMLHEGTEIYVVLSPPARMVARGLEANALTGGKTVMVEAQPSTSDPKEWKAQNITVDGRLVDLMRAPGGP